MWDSSWDSIVNPKYKDIPYDKFLDKNYTDLDYLDFTGTNIEN